MKLKMGLISLTAASVLTVSPVLAEQAADNEERAPITRAQTQRTPSEQNQFDPLTRAENEEIGQDEQAAMEDEELDADSELASQDDETLDRDSQAYREQTMQTPSGQASGEASTAVGGGAAGGSDANLGTQFEGNQERAPVTRAQTQRTPSEQNQFDPLTRAEDEEIGTAEDEEAGADADTALDDEQAELESARQEQTTMETQRRILPEDDQAAVGAGTTAGADQAAVEDDAELGTQLEGGNEERAPITRAQTQRTPSEQNQFDPLTRAEDEEIGEDQAEMEAEGSLQRDRDQAASEMQPQAGEGATPVVIVPVEPVQQAGAGQAGGSTMQQFDRQTVMQVQEALNDRGFSPGPIDGIIGVNTRQALRNFQQDQDMQASGELNQETLAALDVGAQPSVAAGAGAAAGAEEVDLPSDVGTAREPAQVGTAAGTGTSGELLEEIEDTSGLVTEEADDFGDDAAGDSDAGGGAGTSQ